MSKGREGVCGESPARSTGNPEFFYAFFIEKFVTVNGYGLLLPEGPGGGKGYRGHEVASTLRRFAPLREPGVPLI
jgi:hypothetical protein